MADDLARLDAIAQAELVRSGKASPLELVDAAIARIEKLDPELNAVIHPRFEKARAEAASPELPHGPFRGVPFLLKDLGGESVGDPYHAGMKLLKRLDWRAAEDSYFTAQLRAAGFVILGRTNTPELGIVPTTEPEAHGPTHNPWNRDYSPGGSSGGAGAAVASGMVPAAHASDGGGSIRIPASHCGLVGLKPSRGRVSFGPQLGERWNGFSIQHVVSRSLRDSAAILDVVSGAMPGDPYIAPPPRRPFRCETDEDPVPLRIGLMRRGPRQLEIHPDCVAAVDAAAKLLEGLGHHVEESHPPTLDEDTLGRGVANVIFCNEARALDAWSAKTGQPIAQRDVEPITWAVAEIGRKVSASEFLRTLDELQACSRSIAAWWEGGFDLLLTPTTGEPPPPLGSFAAPPDNPLMGFARAVPFGAFTSSFNATGQPAISLPLSWNAAGLPVGVQLVAVAAREDRLLQIAAQLERARPWAERRPAIHA